MNEYKITLRSGNQERIISASDDKTLLESIRGCGAHIDAPCAGNGTCRQCTVKVSGLCRDKRGEVRLYDNEEALSCCLYPAGELFITTKEVQGSKVLTDEIDIPAGGDGLGLAVDIGTTTVAAYLYDLKSGKCIPRRAR